MSFTPEIKLEHADKRGEIYSITLPGDRELMLLHSVPGALRGGHSHDVNEVVLLLTGKMRYYKQTQNGRFGIPFKEQTHGLHAGDVSFPPTAGVLINGLEFTPAGEPHMGEFLEDSWLLEWKLNTKKGKWKNIDYAPYRAKVKANAA